MKLTAYPVLAQDIQSGAVWLPTPHVPPSRLVRIRNTSTGHTLYCEVLPIGESFLRRYNNSADHAIEEPDRAIVLSHWYRTRLGCIQYREFEIELSPAGNSIHAFLACAQHPQIAVRLAIKLSAWGTALGIVGLILGVVSLIK